MSSRIEAGLTIEGSVRGEGELVVAGRLRGALTLQGTLVIEEGGAVEAEVEASSVVVGGLLSGSVTAHEELRIQPGGYVDARVRAARLAVAEGAVFRGELQAMHQDPRALPTHVAVARQAPRIEAVAAPRALESPATSRAVTAPPQPVAPPAPPAPPPARVKGFAAPTRDGAPAPAKPAAPAPAKPDARTTPRMPALPRGRSSVAIRGGGA